MEVWNREDFTQFGTDGLKPQINFYLRQKLFLTLKNFENHYEKNAHHKM